MMQKWIYPEKMVEAQAEQMLEEFAQNIAMQGISFEQYLQFTGATVDQMKNRLSHRHRQELNQALF